jgi:mannose-6-phosphate isomerase-like protein (cupin superfamily)
MKNIKDYISSGIIEMYVLGLASEEEIREVKELSVIYPEVQEEIDAVSNALIRYNKTNVTVSPKVKPLLMATIDYTERLKNGEAPAAVPSLNTQSKISDFEEWLSREDMVHDETAGDAYAKIIGYGPEAMTAIVWMRNEMPYEVHDKEYEKFLIVEGSCNIITRDRVISLVPGDFFEIPLHVGHVVKITSEIACKVVLQRSAA